MTYDLTLLTSYTLPLPPSHEINRDVWHEVERADQQYMLCHKGRRYKDVTVRNDNPRRFVDTLTDDTPYYELRVYLFKGKPAYLVVFYGYDYPEMRMFKHHAYSEISTSPRRVHSYGRIH